MSCVVLIDFGERSAIHTVQFAEELQLWDRRLRRVCGGTWIHNPKQHLGESLETAVHFAEPFHAFFYRHAHARNAKNVIRTVRSETEVEREQLVRIHGVSEDSSRHLEAIPRHGQQNDRQVRPSTEFRTLFEATQWKGRQRDWDKKYTSFCLMILLYTAKLCRNGSPPSPDSFLSSKIRYAKGPSNHTLPVLTVLSVIDQCHLALPGRRASSVSSKVDSRAFSLSKNPAEWQTRS